MVATMFLSRFGAQPTVSDALRDYRNVETYAFNATNTAVLRSNALLQRHDQTLNGNRFELTWDSQLAGRQSTWAGGLDYSVNKQTRFPLSVAGPFGTVNPYDFTTEMFFSLPGVTPGFNPDKTNRLTTLALFLENRTLLTPALSLLTGVRRDSIDLEVTNHRTASASNPAYFERQYTPVTGRAALAYDLTKHANVYVQYSTAADPPAGILTTASLSQVQNFDLTTGKQWELGSKFSFAEQRGQGTLAFYEITRRNIAVSDPASTRSCSSSSASLARRTINGFLSRALPSASSMMRGASSGSIISAFWPRVIAR